MTQTSEYSEALQRMPVYSQGLESLIKAGFQAFFVGGSGGGIYLSLCQSVHLFLGIATSFRLLESADAVRNRCLEPRKMLSLFLEK